MNRETVTHGLFFIVAVLFTGLNIKERFYTKKVEFSFDNLTNKYPLTFYGRVSPT